jgi:hypothetical protein
MHHTKAMTTYLADAVKMLIISNEMLALLRLANHEKVPLEDLIHLGCGHSFGVVHVADVALEISIFTASARYAVEVL